MCGLLRTAPAAADASAAAHHLFKTVDRLGAAGLRLLASCGLAASGPLVFDGAFQAAYYHYWRRSVTAAALARRLSHCLNRDDGDIAYLCGLLTGIGRLPLLMDAWAGAAAPSAAQGAPEVPSEDLRRICQISEALLPGGYPLSAVRGVIRFRHYPMEALRTALPLVKTVSLADALADGMAAGTPADHAFISGFTGLRRLQAEDILSATTEEIHHVHEKLGLPLAASGGERPPHAAPALPQGLGRRMTRQMALNASMEAFDKTDNPAAVLDRLANAISMLCGLAPCIVFRHESESDVLAVVHATPGMDNPGTAIEIPAGSASGIAAAWRSGRTAVLDCDTAEALIMDRQIIDRLGTPGLVAVPFGTGNPLPGMVVCGTDAAAGHGIDLDAVQALSIAAARRCGDPLPAATAPGARHSGPAMQRLIIKKTAHEIRTPLSIIKNYLNVLRLKLPRDHAAQGELTVIDEEIGRIGGLLEHLILPASDAPREWLSVNEIIGKMVTVARASQPSPHRVTIHLDLDEALPAVYSIRDKIKQILLNLIKNAAEALAGGGNIHVHTASDRAPGGKTAPDAIRITVSDDGPGISAAVKDVMFQPFNSTKTAGGAGLGLCIVRAAVTDIGGIITFDSTPDRGTVFTIRLPVCPQDAGDIPPAPETFPQAATEHSPARAFST